MSKYPSNLFLDKKTKRELVQRNVEIISLSGDKGCVVSLCGTSPEQVVNSFRPLLRKRSELLLVERDSKTIEEERLHQRILEIGEQRVAFRAGDLWDMAREKYDRKQGWNHKHVLFDLDFCITARRLIRDENLLEELNWLARSKLPRKSGFWISLTTCQRGDFDADWVGLREKLLIIFRKAGWNSKIDLRENYIDSQSRGGVAMVNMLLRFEWSAWRGGKRRH